MLDGPAPSLARRLLAAASREGVARVLPFWADGGAARPDDPDADPVFAPGRHVLAAYPSSVVRARVEELGPGGLAPFLRAHLPPSAGATAPPLPLVVVVLGYDAGRAVAGHERLLTRPVRAREHAHDALPDVMVVRYDGYLAAESERGPWRALGDTRALERALHDEGPEDDAGPGTLGALGPLVDPDIESEYRKSFERILTGIARGDFYQVNLARRFEAELRSSPGEARLAAAARDVHAALRARQPTAFGALIPILSDTWLISASPECLLSWRAHAEDGAAASARSYPIKGTIGRGAPGADDDALARALHASTKDQAEHVMIVDLVRNDLGQVARVGSVQVPRLFASLALRTVRHLVSEVAAETDADLADTICALFPGGSITGAPKIAAMQALDRCEPFARGLYCGSLGVVRGGREATFSILIRSAVLSGAGLTYAAGGGLVADSTPDAELAEIALKSAAIGAALAGTRKPI